MRSAHCSSGFGMDSDLEQNKAAGFSHHLVKPIDIAVVQRVIAEVTKRYLEEFAH